MASRSQARRKRRHGQGEVPLDSFSDIAFLLIIFFMVATTLIKTHGFMTELPSGQENTDATEDKVPSIVLSGDIIMYNDNQMKLEQLRETLIELELDEKPEEKRIVMLEAKQNVVYKQYFPVWAAIVKSGGIVALVEPEE